MNFIPVKEEERVIILNKLRETFREVIASSMGSSVCEVVEFYFRTNLGKDPYEELWDNPQAFFNILQRVFGSGTEIFVRLLVDGINRKYGLRYDAEALIKLMGDKNEESKKRFREILRRIFGSRNLEVK